MSLFPLCFCDGGSDRRGSSLKDALIVICRVHRQRLVIDQTVIAFGDSIATVAALLASLLASFGLGDCGAYKLSDTFRF
jgi:hypothetical protein